MTLATLNLTQTNQRIADLIHHPEFLWENVGEIHELQLWSSATPNLPFPSQQPIKYYF